jgi:hypothetical protein
MDNSISVGDLVMVVKPHHCGCTNAMGRIFVVQQIEAADGTCNNCGSYRADVEPDALMPEGHWVRVASLKKIPPLSEPESIVERMTVKA